MDNFAVEFTSENQLLVCGGCKRQIRKEDTQYLYNLNSTRPGRSVCPECYQYYVRKTTTHRTDRMFCIFFFHLSTLPICSMPTDTEVAMIRQQVAVAQRGGMFTFFLAAMKFIN